MTRLNGFFLVVGCFFIFNQAQALTLDGAYDAALKRSEDVAIQAELITQAEERLSQAKAAILPNINGVATWFRQQQPTNNSTLSPADQTTAKITADQPLFRGFREFAALRQQRRVAEAQSFTRDQAANQLFQDVTQSFYNVVSAEQDLKDLMNEIEVNHKRLDELNHFLRLGRSRESEVLTLRANIATLEAQVEASHSLIEVARSTLAFLTGLDKYIALEDTENVPALSALEQYTAKVDNRPDVKSYRKSEEAAHEGIAIARGGHLPSIDLLADYYLTRPGYLSDVKWDVELALTIPIFQGFAIQSEVRQAVSVEKESDYALSKTKRQAFEQIESLYQQIRFDLTQIEKQKNAVDLSNRNYQAEIHDYKLGLVTNIDVLASLTGSQDSQRVLDKIQYQLKIDYLHLLAATAERPKL